MSGFSQHIDSPFPSMNELLAPRAAYDAHQNALMSLQTGQQALQHGQQAMDAVDMEYAARAASVLLGITDPAARAAAYPQILQSLPPSLRGRAPSTLPDEQTLRGLAAMGTSSAEQYKTQQAGAAGAGVVGAYGFGPQSSVAPSGGGGVATAGGGSNTRPEASGAPPAAGTPGAAVAQQTHDFWKGQGYNEEQIAGILAGGPGSESDFTPTVWGDGRTSYGKYQHHATRLSNPQKTGLFDRYGPNPTSAQQDEYAAWEISPAGPLARVGEQLKNAKTSEEAATIWTRDFGVPADKTEIPRRARGARRYVGIYGGEQQAATAPVAPADGAAPAAPYQVAGAVVGPPGGASGPDLNGPRPLPPIGPGSPVVTPQGIANTPINAPPPVQQAQAAPAQPPPAPTPPPAAQMPAELQTDGHQLTPRDRAELAPLAGLVTQGRLPAVTFQNEVQQRQAANVARQDKWVAQQAAAEQKNYQRGRDAVADQGAAKNAQLNQAKFDAEQVTAGRAYPGKTADDADNNILLEGTKSGNVGTPEYANAYSRQRIKHTDTGIAYPHDLSMFKTPTMVPEDPAATGGRSYGNVRADVGVDPVALRKAETEAAGLLFALDTFRDKAKSASMAERLATVAGAPTGLGTAWTNAALLAKGKLLFDLGVLNGADYSIVKAAIAHPGTFMGAMASNETIDSQVNQLKAIINTSLDAQRNYGKAKPAEKQADEGAAAAPRVIRYDHQGNRIEE